MQVQSSTTGHLGERIFALIDHDLSPQDEASARHHLDECEDCAEEHRKIAGAVSAVAGLGRARAPEGFAARVMRRVRSERRTSGFNVLAEQKVPYEGVIILILAAAMTAAIFAFMAQGGWNVVAHNLNGAGPR
jgi:anti-sigma factor RsiW